MAVDYGILTRTPSVGERYMEGLQMRQADAERNMLRQQQVMQFQQAQQDRAFQLEERKKQAERNAQFEGVAKLIREQGMDPDDPKVLGQFAEAALKAQNPALVSFVGEMAERAAKRREAAAVQKRIQTAMGGVEGPPEPAANALAPAPAVSPAVNAMLAPPPAQRELLAGTPFAIGMAPPPAAAPAPAAPAAPAVTDNARKIADLERRRDALLLGGTERELAAAKVLDAQINKLQPKPLQGEAATMQALGLPLTPEGYERFKNMGQRGTPAETEEIVLRLQDPNLPPASRKALENRLNILTTREPKEPKADDTKVVAFRETDAAGNVTFLNKFGQVIKPTEAGGAPIAIKGKPSATFEKTTAQRKQLSIDLDRAIIELTDAAKPGGLIDRSTGSGAGQLRDIAMGFGGVASSGAIAGSELAPISDLVLKMVPRFEGPQSNKDTTSYERAAGQLANTALPNAQRKAAADVLIRLMKERKGQFVSAAMAAEGTGAAPAAPTGARPSLDSIFK